HPLPRETRTLSFHGAPESLNSLLLSILASRLTPSGLQLRAAPAGASLDVRFDGTAAGIQAQADQVQHLAAPPLTVEETPTGVWASHQAIWEGAGPALVGKLSVLPSHLAAACTLIERTAAAGSLTWKVVLQGVGTGYVRLEGSEPALRTALLALRDH